MKKLPMNDWYIYEYMAAETWDVATAFSTDDMCYHLSVFYKALGATTGDIPASSAAEWEVVADPIETEGDNAKFYSYTLNRITTCFGESYHEDLLLKVSQLITGADKEWKKIFEMRRYLNSAYAADFHSEYAKGRNIAYRMNDIRKRTSQLA